MKKIAKISPLVCFSIIFVISYLLGCYLLILQGKELINNTFWEEELFYKLNNITIHKNALVLLCLWKRTCGIIFLLLFAHTFMGIPVCLFFTIFSAVSIGYFLQFLIVKYGIQGILIYLAVTMPQGIFYGLGFSLVLITSIHINKNRKNKLLQNEGGINGGRIVIAFFLIGVGCICEGYMNLYHILFL